MDVIWAFSGVLKDHTPGEITEISIDTLKLIYRASLLGNLGAWHPIALKLAR